MNKMYFLAGAVAMAGAAVIFKMAGDRPNDVGPSAQGQAALEAGAPIVTVKVPAEFSSGARLGQKAFTAKCAACHGADAGGREGSAPPLVHKIYEPSHHGDESFQLAVKNGVRAHHWKFGNMPLVDGLTRGDVKGIVAYIRELQRENGIN
ncbi:c-type cytochrome [Phaeobacter gallaeciensis]|uniref:c-type cytochrome n=1 Tax=Phaeobacter gallaeciensis TaxID=60890 RepID=UPI00237F21DC|nr:cytochrome c [Phaeobacter gallaeciensis]MDE4099703.1 cytochrome c [Phaeobacter gallaeciensis]MDE4108562.1 cytochrome c [Phaeobacter gallaeciensis]MDE4110422.1 cytochrome c [Phaeobacter gallaeciensis]MDE4117344.1 cytochrome c [Phaeobacter gallaeciensis]MDE4121817.1 cytochrome c [Phaeobacter gallaeciensis]